MHAFHLLTSVLGCLPRSSFLTGTEEEEKTQERQEAAPRDPTVKQSLR